MYDYQYMAMWPNSIEFNVISKVINNNLLYQSSNASTKCLWMRIDFMVEDYLKKFKFVNYSNSISFSPMNNKHNFVIAI